MNATVKLPKNGSKRCRNTIDDVQCEGRVDDPEHLAGACPTRLRRIQRVEERRERGRVAMSFDAGEIEAAEQLLALIRRGADMRQVAASEGFKRFAATVQRGAKRLKKASER